MPCPPPRTAPATYTALRRSAYPGTPQRTRLLNCAPDQVSSIGRGVTAPCYLGPARLVLGATQN